MSGKSVLFVSDRRSADRYDILPLVARAQQWFLTETSKLRKPSHPRNAALRRRQAVYFQIGFDVHSDERATELEEAEGILWWRETDRF